MSKKNSTPDSEKKQSDRFIEAAREAGCSEDEAAFDEMMRKLTKAKPPPKADKDDDDKKPGH
jgi:hypothetical protein